MAGNVLLTPNQITRKALMILEQKLNFISGINRQYDDSFAKSGAKIGDTLRIRLPNQYVVRSGATLAAQDTVEQSLTLPITSQKGVDTTFSSAELTLSMDDFTERILNPAMSVLSAEMERDALSMMADVPFQVGSPGIIPTDLLTYLSAKGVMDINLAPMDDQRRMIIAPLMEVNLVNALKGLFQSSSAISEQYTNGSMGKTAGFDFYTNTLLPSQQIGSMVTGVTLGAGLLAEGATTAVFTGTVVNGTTFKKGQTFTLANVYACHPQTKQPTTDLLKLVVTADVTATSTSVNVPFWPALYVTNTGLKNVVAMPGTSAPVAFAAGVNALYAQGIGFQKNAFTFASADLIMPDGVHFKAREVWQGLSMRIVQAFDINSDKFPCRLDVLYG